MSAAFPEPPAPSETKRKLMGHSSIRNKKEADGPSHFLSSSLRDLDPVIYRVYL